MNSLVCVCFLFICALLAAVDRANAAGSRGLFCNMCTTMLKDETTACREPETYQSVNCTAIFPQSKYCVIINGNLTIVANAFLKTQALGPRRACQIDLDRYEVREADIKPGCFPVYLDKPDYLAFKHFHFDGEICLCNDEDNCNFGERWTPKPPSVVPRNNKDTVARVTGKNSAVVPGSGSAAITLAVAFFVRFGLHNM
ncbi:hypothetical protein BV898_15917 [Hypsibius exemplaris]|uniref:Uncharacterized protein n=1 Tax=Hypsibius exemplaris TaxID=2072580 RepID=A0A9X6NET3_HYPEX|nr:hypothetical protein BV898_15917 [Hypsibius exemplaris]